MPLFPESGLVAGQTGHFAWAYEVGKFLNAAAVNVRDVDYAGGATGVTGSDATAAVAAAVAAAPDGGVVVFPPLASSANQAVYDISTVALPNKALTIVAHGAVLNGTASGSYIFTQANRKKLTLLGGTYTGAGHGVSYSLAASDSQSYDLCARDVRFLLNSTKRGLNLVGVREATIDDCFFDALNEGIYLNLSVNVGIRGCQFRNCVKGVFADGASPAGDAHHAGTFVDGCTMLGCGWGVHAIGWDYLAIRGGMIDYCDRPVLVTNPTGGLIDGVYLSNRDVGSVAYPVIDIDSDAAGPYGFAQHMKVVNNQIVCHNSTTTQAQSIGVRVEGEHHQVRSNTIHFWYQYGVQLADAAPYAKVVGNRLASPFSTSGAAGVRGEVTGSADTWLLAENDWNKAASNIGAARLRENLLT